MLTVDLKDDRSEIVHYDFEDYPIYIRKALLSSYNNFEAPLHWHDDIEFIAVLQGEMNYNINGEIITLMQNEGVFVNSRQLHFGFSKAKTECDFICVLIHPLMLCVSGAIEQKYVVPLLENQNVSYMLSCPLINRGKRSCYTVSQVCIGQRTIYSRLLPSPPYF